MAILVSTNEIPAREMCDLTASSSLNLEKEDWSRAPSSSVVPSQTLSLLVRTASQLDIYKPYKRDICNFRTHPPLIQYYPRQMNAEQRKRHSLEVRRSRPNLAAAKSALWVDFGMSNIDTTMLIDTFKGCENYLWAQLNTNDDGSHHGLGCGTLRGVVYFTEASSAETLIAQHPDIVIAEKKCRLTICQFRTKQTVAGFHVPEFGITLPVAQHKRNIDEAWKPFLVPDGLRVPRHLRKRPHYSMLEDDSYDGPYRGKRIGGPFFAAAVPQPSSTINGVQAPQVSRHTNSGNSAVNIPLQTPAAEDTKIQKRQQAADDFMNLQPKL